MSAIGPGDFVVCVNAAPEPGTIWGREDALTEGAVYLVTECFNLSDGDPVVSLLGRNRSEASAQWGEKTGYCITRFRPFNGPEQAPRIKSREVEDA